MFTSFDIELVVEEQLGVGTSFFELIVSFDFFGESILVAAALTIN